MSRRGAVSEKVHHEVLPNGLTLLFRESHAAPVADVQIWANVGSADERKHEAGLAHFHEHMLFKGTERRGVGEVAGEIEGAGGRINAYTSFDVTVYYATIPSDAIETGLDVLVDAVRHSTFDPVEIDREIEVVLEEIRRSQDSPAHVLSDAVFREHYHKHRYGLPILGPAESVASFDRRKVTNFWKRWYTPNNMVVVAAGDFDAKRLARQIKKHFKDAAPGSATRKRVREPRQKEWRSVIVKRPFERMKLDLTWPSAAFRDDDATHLDLLSFLFGEAESSRLVRRVREHEGLADRIDSSSYTPVDPGVFSINIDAEDTKAHDVVRACMREVERLRSEPVGQDELDRARANFLASEHFERETASGLASKLGNFHLLGGDWRSEERYFELLRAATVHDLQRVARKYLTPEALTAGVLLPKASGVKVTRRSLERAIRGGIADAHATAPTPKRLGGKARARTKSAKRRAAKNDSIESYVLDGGTELHVHPRRNAPVMAVRAAFLGGLLAQTTETAGLCHFLSSTWTRGTERLTAGAFARAVEDIASEVEGFSGRSSLGLTLDVATDQLEPALDLFAEVLLAPGFDAEEVEKQRRETLATIERLEDQLASQAFALFARTHFEKHPYRLPMIGTRETVASFDEATLRAHQARLIGSKNLAIGVAGDVDPDAIAAGISQRLAALPEGARLRDELPALEAAPHSIRTSALHKDRAQAHLVMGFRGLSVGDDDRPALDVICQLLAGQSGRLFLELRDKQSLAYSVSAMSVEGYAPGYFIVYIATAPEKLEAARTGMLAELTRLLDSPPDEREFEQARRNLIGNHAISQQRNSGHAAHLALDAVYGLGAGANLHFGEKVAEVTREDVMRVARRIIKLDAYTEAVVAP
ncbi:MAG: pitrilysin family protein [Myxococcota bacterium]|jgi:zinc protease|nr:pitrilysin family protein [Myxococcota bacterium]